MAIPQVTLKRSGLKHLLSGHPWIFREGVQGSEAKGGDIVRIVSDDGRALGSGMYSSSSRIAVRVMSRTSEIIDDTEIARRTHGAIERRATHLGPTEIQRLIHAEADGLPALIVDRYGNTLVLQATAAGSERILPVVLSAIDEHFEIKTIVARHDLGVRALEGLPQETKVLRGEVSGLIEITDGGKRHFVDVMGGQKTGLYLDQRANRGVAGGLINGGRVLDVFCYQAESGISVSDKVDEVVAIDSSSVALDRAKLSLEANGLNSRVRLVKAKAINYLRNLADSKESFDAIFLDPPAFAKSRRDLGGARRGYREINLRAMQLLKPGGLLITSSCSYHLSEEDLAARCSEAASDSGSVYHIVTRGRQGEDHPILLGHPESWYLKTLFLRRVS